MPTSDDDYDDGRDGLMRNQASGMRESQPADLPDGRSARRSTSPHHSVKFASTKI